jgi:DNA adenine methylase
MSEKLQPLIWIGGKYYLTKHLLPLIPEHFSYIEVFGGAAALLFAKKPSKLEVYNDINSDLVNFFRVLRDENKFKEFYKRVCLIPYSREEFYFCRDTYTDSSLDEIEKAVRFFVAVRQSFSGNISSWSYSRSFSRRGMSMVVSAYLNCIETLPEVHERLMRVQIEHDDFRNILKRYDTRDTFFYCDPPYVPETRRDDKYYKHEMTLEDHKELVEILLNLKGKVMLSGYDHEVYRPLEENGWIKKSFDVPCHGSLVTRDENNNITTRKERRIECVWLSYNVDDRLL